MAQVNATWLLRPLSSACRLLLPMPGRSPLLEGSHHLDERFAALERVQDRREVLSRDGEAGLLGACSRSAPRRTFGSSNLANVEVLNLGDDDAGEAGRERRGSYKENPSQR